MREKRGERTCELGRHEAVAAREAHGIGEDRARDRVARAQAGSGSRDLGLLSLEANVELEVLNVVVEQARSVLHAQSIPMSLQE